MPVRRRASLPAHVFLARFPVAWIVTVPTLLVAAGASESGGCASPAASDAGQAAPASAPATPVSSSAAPTSADAGVRRARMAEVSIAGLPADMTAPESRTRWDLSAIPAVAPRTIETRPAIGESPASGLQSEPGADILSRARTLIDPSGGGDATAWLFPDRDRDALRPGVRRVLDLEEVSLAAAGDVPDRLRIEVETVGVGWV